MVRALASDVLARTGASGDRWVSGALRRNFRKHQSLHKLYKIGRCTRFIEACAATRSEDLATTKRHSPQRLCSNLDPELRHRPGNVASAATLVAGTAVGAGILALPAVCQPSGFVASGTALTAAAGFSIITGLLIAEVSVNTMCELGCGRGISLGSMARRTLGNSGAMAVEATYLLLHYSLLVAYIAKAGEILSNATNFPQPAADAIFTVSMGSLCYGARPSVLDSANTALVGGVVLSFLCLLGFILPGIHLEALVQSNWDRVPEALPVIALAFVFQNVVPVIASSLEGDIVKIRSAIILGVTVPLLMFLAWDAAVLGSTASIADPSLAASNINAATTSPASPIDPLALVRSSGPVAEKLVDVFSLLAVATSTIGFVLGLSEFIMDSFDHSLGGSRVLDKKATAYSATLAPPLLLAISNPGMFFAALDFAGTYGVLVLFGMVPVAMVVSERYAGTTLCAIKVAPGGPTMLALTGLTAGGIILNEIITSF